MSFSQPEDRWDFEDSNIMSIFSENADMEQWQKMGRVWGVDEKKNKLVHCLKINK